MVNLSELVVVMWGDACGCYGGMLGGCCSDAEITRGEKGSGEGVEDFSVFSRIH